MSESTWSHGVKDDLGKVKADPAQVEQVIMNLW